MGETEDGGLASTALGLDRTAEDCLLGPCVLEGGAGGETGVAGLPEPRNAGSFTLVQIQGGTLLLLYLDTVASHGELQE